MREAEQAEKEESSHAAKCCFLPVLWLTCNPGEFQKVINPKTALCFLVLKYPRAFSWTSWQRVWLLEMVAVP